MPKASGVLFDSVATKGGENGGRPCGTNCCAQAGASPALEIATINRAPALVDLMTRPFCLKPLPRQAVEEREDGVDERLRLVDVGGMAGGGNHHLLRARDFRRHIIGGGEERCVVGSDHD